VKAIQIYQTKLEEREFIITDMRTSDLTYVCNI